MWCVAFFDSGLLDYISMFIIYFAKCHDGWDSMLRSRDYSRIKIWPTWGNIACLYYHTHTNKVCHFHFANCTSPFVDPEKGCSWYSEALFTRCKLCTLSALPKLSDQNSPKPSNITDTFLPPNYFSIPLSWMQSSWRWRQNVPPKLQNRLSLHSVQTQNMTIIWTTAAMEA